MSKSKGKPTEPSTCPELKLTLQLYWGTEVAIGPEMVELLEAIRETGSISSGCKRVEMSYRRAWSLVDQMNRCFKHPVVIASKGGTNGGGAVVSAFGHDIVKKYKKMQQASQQAALTFLELFENSTALVAQKPSEK